MDTRITGLSFAPKLLAASQSFVALPAPAQTPAPADQVVLSQPQTQPAPPAPQPPAPQPQQPAPQPPNVVQQVARNVAQVTEHVMADDLDVPTFLRRQAQKAGA